MSTVEIGFEITLDEQIQFQVIPDVELRVAANNPRGLIWFGFFVVLTQLECGLVE